MIIGSKQKSALLAVQDIIVAAKIMSFKKEAHGSIAHLLDEAEYLQGMIIEPSERSDDFRSHLEDLCNEYNFYYILQHYDQNQ